MYHPAACLSQKYSGSFGWASKMQPPLVLGPKSQALLARLSWALSCTMSPLAFVFQVCWINLPEIPMTHLPWASFWFWLLIKPGFYVYKHPHYSILPIILHKSDLKPHQVLPAKKTLSSGLTNMGFCVFMLSNDLGSKKIMLYHIRLS